MHKTAPARTEPDVTETMPARRPTPGRLKRLAQNLALSAASLLVFLLLFEGVLRGLGYGKAEIYRPDPELYWTLAPNQHRFTKVNQLPVITNSHGTRGPEFAVPKPANTFRILSIGDSRTFGWGLSDQQTYSRRVQTLLQPLVPPGRRVEVINAGVNAWSYDQLRMFLRDVGLKWQPDLVLVGGANLWTQFSEEASPQFHKTFEQRVWLKNLLRRSAIYTWAFEVKLGWLYARLRTRFIPLDPTNNPLGQTPFWQARAHYADQLTGIGQLLRQHGVPGLFLFFPSEGAVQGRPESGDSIMLPVTHEVAQAAGMPFLDLTDALRRAGSNGLYLEGDPAHPNARGDSVIAAAIVDELRRDPALLAGAAPVRPGP